VNVSRCGECNMPSTSGPLYVSGRRALCGMCLWAENADLRKRVRMAQRVASEERNSETATSGWWAVKRMLEALDLRRPVKRKGAR
jgi:hypothetical protein